MVRINKKWTPTYQNHFCRWVTIFPANIVLCSNGNLTPQKGSILKSDTSFRKFGKKLRFLWGPKPCLVLIYFCNLRFKKHGQNHKKTGGWVSIFYDFDHVFKILNYGKNLLINKLPYPRKKFSIDPNFPKLVSDFKIEPI